jgi:cytochrome P450
VIPAAPPIDLTDPAVVADPYPSFARARVQAPVQWHEGLGLWLAFTHAESDAVLRDRRLGRIWRDREPAERFGSFNLVHRNALLEMEPPDHTRLRRLVSAAFARGHVERLRPWVQRLAGELVDGLVERSGGTEPVDVLSGMAEELPVAVIAELLGVPEADRPLLRPWSNAIVKMYEYGRTAAVEDAAERAADQFVTYLRGLAAERRRTPGEDLLSHLVGVRDSDGDRLTEDELVTTCVLLLNAGHEATVNVSGNGLLALLEHPDQLARLRDDPGLLSTAVEEFMRFDSPLQLFERTATTDVQVGGVTVREGQKVAALLGAANRDPAVFPDPTGSTSAGPTTRTSPSGPACTSASAPRWPAWSCRPPSAPCWSAPPGWSSAGSRCAVRSSSSAASPSCPSCCVDCRPPAAARCRPRCR